MNVDHPVSLTPEHLTMADKWILTRFRQAVEDITAHNEEGEFGLSANRIYDFAWSEFCDWYIELAKPWLLGDDQTAKETVQGVLLYVLEGLLKLLHPFMPFLTEQVYRYLPSSDGFLMLKEWPKSETIPVFPQEADEMERIMEVIRSIRNLRTEMNVQMGKRTRVLFQATEDSRTILESAIAYFQRLAGASEVGFVENANDIQEKTVSAVTHAGTVYIPLGDLVDFAKEKARLEKELEKLQQEISRTEGKLNNPGFVNKAPAQLVTQEREKLEANRVKATALEQRIQELKESLA